MYVCNKEDQKFINDKDIVSRNQLIEKHYGLVQGFMIKNLFDKQLAHELTQEVMYKVIMNFDKYDKMYPFNCWVHSIARNHLIDYYKHTKSKAFKQSENMYDVYDSKVIDLLTDNSDIVDSIYTYDIINLLKRKAHVIFTKKEQQFFIARFIDDLEPKELSEVFKIPRKQVYQYIINIRYKIRKYIERC